MTAVKTPRRRAAGRIGLEMKKGLGLLLLLLGAALVALIAALYIVANLY